jgi:hypothetical protein
MAKPKGWVKEPVRHGLAAKGIKTVKGTREHPMAWFRNPRTGDVEFLPPGVAKREGYTTGPYKSHNAAHVMGELRERGAIFSPMVESIMPSRWLKLPNRSEHVRYWTIKEGDVIEARISRGGNAYHYMVRRMKDGGKTGWYISEEIDSGTNEEFGSAQRSAERKAKKAAKIYRR